MRQTATLCLLCCLLAGCSATFPSVDPVAAKEHRNRAEELIYRKDYPGASSELAQAIRRSPQDGYLYLRHAEIQEVLGKNREARATYAKGRRALAEDAPHHPELTYRQALLVAAKLNDPQQALSLRDELAEGSIRRLDVEATIAVGEGHGRQALLLLNEALRQQPTTDTAARILYHAARAYQLLGDQKNANGALYQAINLTKDLALTKDIEGLWNALKGADH